MPWLYDVPDPLDACSEAPPGDCGHCAGCGSVTPYGLAEGEDHDGYSEPSASAVGEDDNTCLGCGEPLDIDDTGQFCGNCPDNLAFYIDEEEDS